MSRSEYFYDYVADEARSAERFTAGTEARFGHTEATPSAREAEREERDWRGGYR